jgi:hypothetical protein
MSYDHFTMRFDTGQHPGWLVYIGKKVLGPFATHKQAVRAAKKELKASSASPITNFLPVKGVCDNSNPPQKWHERKQ